MRVPGNTASWLQVALAGLGLATVLALAAPLGWPFELFAHFRAQYAVAALLLAVALLPLGSRRAAAIAAVLAVFHALPALQRTVADEPSSACSGPAFTVVTANLQFSNHDTRRFIDWLEAHPADLVVLQEVTGAWQRALLQVAGYQTAAPRARGSVRTRCIEPLAGRVVRTAGPRRRRAAVDVRPGRDRRPAAAVPAPAHSLADPAGTGPSA